jgi:hypothetical protein
MLLPDNGSVPARRVGVKNRIPGSPQNHYHLTQRKGRAPGGETQDQGGDRRMKRSIIVCCALTLGCVGNVLASAPQSLTQKEKAAAAAAAKAAADARIEAAQLSRAQDRAVASYKRYQARAAAEAKLKHDKAKTVQARADEKAKQEANALANAYDRALASHKQHVSRGLAVDKLAAEKAAASAAQAAKRAKQEAAALAAAQDRVVAYYRRSIGKDAGPALAVKRIEKLACFSGIKDRHARIGVQLVDGKIDYFAYYSKWKPRTCSIEAERNGPYARWEDNGATSTIFLVDDKGSLTIDRKGGAFRFVFHDVDRMRYCGMSGKINGSLTVVRGKSTCVVEGVMDGHEG